MKNHKKTDSGRRRFLKNSALGAGALGTLLPSQLLASNADSSRPDNENAELVIAGYEYPRIEALVSKKVKIKGRDHRFQSGKISDMNTHVFSGPQENDISEIGLLPFILAYENEGFRDYCLLPVFPLRVFRHKSIFVNSESGINNPQDLKGKKVGTPGYSSTSLVWIRGMLKDEYGLDPGDVHWVVSRADSTKDVGGKASKQERNIPKGIKVSYGEEGKDESELLVSGAVDALFHAAEPKAFAEGDPRVRRLFPDSKKVEQEYFGKTGIFPIMHALAVKRTLLDQDLELATSIFKAYSSAKKMSYGFMRRLGWAFDSLPWYGQEYESTRKLMGDNFYSYGYSSNLNTLQTLCRYAFEQGLASRRVKPEELFHPKAVQLDEKA